ncbi:hypothetical protein Tco_1458085 [Tanacetum coccineum]
MTHHFSTPVIQNTVYETLGKNPHILAQPSSQLQSSYGIVASLIEFELKKILIDKMTRSNREKDDDQDKDHPAGSNQGLKRRKTSKETETSKKTSTSKDSSKGKSPATSSKSDKSTKEQVEEPIFVQDSNDDAEFDNAEMPMDQGKDLGNTNGQLNEEVAPKNDWYKKSKRDSSPDPEWNVGKSVDDDPEQNWLNDLAKATKPPLTFNELMHTPIDFSVFTMTCLKIDNLIKDDLVGPVYNLLKGTCKSYVELDYIMEECYFFFNSDLEYLRGGSNDKKCTVSTTNSKAAKYELKGIEDMHDVYSTKRTLSIISVKVNEWYGYGHLKEIVVKRANQKLYTFKEGDFKRLHLNDIKYMLLLVVQNKLHNLDGNVFIHMVVCLRMFAQKTIIQVRVQDLQLGVESYQKKLNLTKPRTRNVDMSRRPTYTTILNPQGVIYEDKLKRKRFMRTDELHKFSDDNLILVRDTLHQMDKDLHLGYNRGMKTRL